MTRKTLLTSAAGLAALAGLSYLYSSVSTIAIASAPAAPVVQASIPEVTPQIVRDVVRPEYREQFERFLAETDPLPKNKPVRLAAVDPDPVTIAVAMRAPPLPATHNASVMPCTPISAEQAAPPRSKYFEIGDKVKLTVYEQSEDVPDKWKKDAKPTKSFQKFQELSDEFTVMEDNTISLPLLGSVSVANKSPQDLQTILADAFSKLTGRTAFVTVMATERPSVSVLGPVKNPGSYKFQPGMTVWHAVAAAGGFDRQGPEPWQKIDVVREQSKRFGGLETISDLLVRATVLKAERDKTTAVPPPQLIELVGEARARQMVAAEVDKRGPILAARQGRDQALDQQIRYAQQEISQSQSRLKPYDENLRLRTERATAVKGLAERGTVSRITATMAQSDAVDAENKRAEMVNQITQAQQRLAQLEQEKARMIADTRAEIERDILAIEQQVTSTSRDTETSAGILGAMKVKFEQQQATGNKEAFIYEVVRQTPNGPAVFQSRGMTVLNPGDLVRIVTPDESPTAAQQPGTVVPPLNGPTNTGIKPISAAVACR